MPSLSSDPFMYLRRRIISGGVAVRGAGNSLASPYRFVLPRGRIAQRFTNNASYDRMLTALMTRTRAVAPNKIALVFANRAMSASASEQVNTNTITVRAAWERCGATNTVQKVTFAGQDSITLQPGDIVTSDFLPGSAWGAGPRWPSNTFFAAKTETVVPALNNKWPGGFLVGSGPVATGGVTGTRTDQAVAFPDATGSANQVYATGAIVTTGGSTAVQGHVPVAYIGEYESGDIGLPAVMLHGDSIGDTAYASNFQYFSTGGPFFDTAMRTLTYPYVKAAIASGNMQNYVTGDSTLQKYLMPFASHLVVEDGTNDTASNLPAATLFSVLQQLNADFKARGGKKLIGLSLLPRTSTNNGFIDAPGQTPANNFGNGQNRDIYNALVAGYADTFVNTGASLEDAGDHTKWLTNGVANTYVAVNDAPLGIHPTQAGHDIMSAVLAAAGTGWTL